MPVPTKRKPQFVKGASYLFCRTKDTHHILTITYKLELDGKYKIFKHAVDGRNHRRGHVLKKFGHEELKLAEECCYSAAMTGG